MAIGIGLEDFLLDMGHIDVLRGVCVLTLLVGGWNGQPPVSVEELSWGVTFCLILDCDLPERLMLAIVYRNQNDIVAYT